MILKIASESSEEVVNFVKISTKIANELKNGIDLQSFLEDRSNVVKVL